MSYDLFFHTRAGRPPLTAAQPPRELLRAFKEPPALSELKLVAFDQVLDAELVASQQAG